MKMFKQRELIKENLKSLLNKPKPARDGARLSSTSASYTIGTHVVAQTKSYNTKTNNAYTMTPKGVTQKEKLMNRSSSVKPKERISIVNRNSVTPLTFTKINTTQDSTTLNEYNNFVHPQNYSKVLGFRQKQPLVKTQESVQGIRRVLLYLKAVAENAKKENKTYEIAVIMENPKGIKVDSMSARGGKMHSQTCMTSVPSGSHVEDHATSVLNLLNLTIARIATSTKIPGLTFVPYTTKEMIKSLTEMPTVNYRFLTEKNFQTSDVVGNAEGCKEKNLDLAGVLLLNPGPSPLSTLARLVFSSAVSKTSNTSTVGAIGVLCAKKGLPLIALSDISSSLTYCTYPLLCNTNSNTGKNSLSELYFVLDLFSYGLVQLANELNSTPNRMP